MRLHRLLTASLLTLLALLSVSEAQEPSRQLLEFRAEVQGEGDHLRVRLYAANPTPEGVEMYRFANEMAEISLSGEVLVEDDKIGVTFPDFPMATHEWPFGRPAWPVVIRTVAAGEEVLVADTVGVWVGEAPVLSGAEVLELVVRRRLRAVGSEDLEDWLISPSGVEIRATIGQESGDRESFRTESE